MKIINGTGILNPNIAIVGEAPGADEEIQGKPFVGRSGQVIDQILKDIGLPRERCYITNAVKYRPQHNKTPTDAEIRYWQEYLYTEISYVNPTIIITLGVVPWKALNGHFTSPGDWRITKNRGEIRESCIGRGKEAGPDGSHYYPYIPTLHPAYCYRNPKEIETLKADFLKALKYSTNQAMNDLVVESERLGLYK